MPISSTPTMRDPTIELTIWEGSKMAIALRANGKSVLWVLKHLKAVRRPWLLPHCGAGDRQGFHALLPQILCESCLTQGFRFSNESLTGLASIFPRSLDSSHDHQWRPRAHPGWSPSGNHHARASNICPSCRCSVLRQIDKYGCLRGSLSTFVVVWT